MPNFGLHQLTRRDFLLGATAGVSAGLGSWFLAPDDWHEARLPFGTKLSYSQCGEDLLIASWFEMLTIERPSYLDIGAYDPIIGSNTYRFYRTGSRGVLVEPNLALTEKLKSVRTGDIVPPFGIGIDDVTEADYYLMSLPQRNTFDKDAAEAAVRESGGRIQIQQIVKMPLRNVNEIIAEHFKGQSPDFLSIDVEGLDVPILKTIDFAKYRPAIICAEHGQPAEDRAALVELLANHEYELRGLTFPNSIFVDSRRLK